MLSTSINFHFAAARHCFRLGVVLFCLAVTACNTVATTAPKKTVVVPKLPDLEASVLQAPIVLPTPELKALLVRRIPSPLLAGTTPTYHFKVANRKQEAKKNWLDRWAKPLLEWVDETMDASATFQYQVELSGLELWFEGSAVHTDISIDLRLAVKWENGLKWQGQKKLLRNNLDCPLQLRLQMDGTVALTEGSIWTYETLFFQTIASSGLAWIVAADCKACFERFKRRH